MDTNLNDKNIIRESLLQQDNTGFTPLHYAFKYQKKKLAGHLIQYLTVEDLFSLRQMQNTSGECMAHYRSALPYFINPETENKELAQQERGEEDSKEKEKEKEVYTEAKRLIEVSNNWLLFHDKSNETTVTLAIKTGNIKKIKRVFKYIEWQTLDLQQKKQVILYACQYGNREILEFIRNQAQSSELSYFKINNSKRIEAALHKNRKLNITEFENVIAEKTCLFDLFNFFAYLSWELKIKSYWQKCDDKMLSDFIKILNNLKSQKKPLHNLSNASDESSKFDKNYLKLRMVMSNQVNSLMDKGQQLYNEFIAYLQEEKNVLNTEENKIADRILKSLQLEKIIHTQEEITEEKESFVLL